MEKIWFDRFSDRAFWDELVKTYLETGKAPGKTPYSYVESLWDYFKFCLLSDNRFFFSSPLLPAIREKIHQHIFVLPANTTIFRARIDSKDYFQDKARRLLMVKEFEEKKKQSSVEEEDSVDELIKRFSSFEGYDAYRGQKESGFEGFSAEESMAPPAFITSQGRCNLPNSPHLYASGDVHTAIVEIRPFIHDTVSVASLSFEKDLKLVDFRFDFKNKAVFDDKFYMAMCFDFSAVSKAGENDYFATQYLTMLVKSMGYDGVLFKSSLVMNGTNYVVFNDSFCKPISSKLYTVVQARYDVLPVCHDSYLKDSNGNNVPDPPWHQS